MIDHQARRLIGDAYKATEVVLKANRDKLKILAETLLEKETLNYNDVVKLIGPAAIRGEEDDWITWFRPNSARWFGNQTTISRTAASSSKWLTIG